MPDFEPIIAPSNSVFWEELELLGDFDQKWGPSLSHMLHELPITDVRRFHVLALMIPMLPSQSKQGVMEYLAKEMAEAEQVAEALRLQVEAEAKKLPKRKKNTATERGPFDPPNAPEIEEEDPFA